MSVTSRGAVHPKVKPLLGQIDLVLKDDGMESVEENRDFNNMLPFRLKFNLPSKANILKL